MRRQLVFSLVFLAGLVPAVAFAGRIFGDIKLEGKPLPAGVPVMISRAPEGGKGPATMVDSTSTDKFGAYKLNVKDEGKCTLTIVYEKQTVPFEAFSYKEATRYDLILEKKDGKFSLRRK